MLTVLTPTGERPEAFELCQRMMARQTYNGPVIWIVVDDGRTPSGVWLKRAKWNVEIIRPEPLWAPGQNTQGRNLLAGLARVGPDTVLTIVEDDDYYAPEWLQWVADHSREAELIGEGDAIYYNVRRRKYRRLSNTEHASLRCTAIRGAAIETFRDVLAVPYRYYDLRLWAQHKDRKVFERRLTVGMKALPGRAGIALGHDGKGNDDKDGTQLRALIGDDADWYLPFYQEGRIMDKLIVSKPFRYNRRDWKVGEEFIPVKRIDGELHMHAGKVRKDERKTLTAKPPANRVLQVKNQEAKLVETIIEKAPEPALAPAMADPVGDEDKKPAKPEAKRTFSRK